ncbi:GntR family transcriptional regulator [Oceaniradius stylonematis]|uniref:GntR family transcriptional regulator n=1 Tax=Oceaniradius stylonematis TaxID=2184161 RepID=UPI00273EC805|nr:GntR family transcriptional regulator [Oceaniradius stylonematis]
MSIFSGNKSLLTTRASAAIADIIRAEILAGSLKPDHPLLERDIALELGVSRTPVREALFVLQGEGLVELEPRRFARVRKISPSDISQIYSLRAVLEAHSARSAARLADNDAILAIEMALAKQRNLDKNCTATEQTNADLEFHAAIAAASNSPIMKTVAHQVLAVTASLRSRIKYEGGRNRQAIAQHKAILAAIKAREAEKAGTLMMEHIEASRMYSEKKLFNLWNDDQAGK